MESLEDEVAIVTGAAGGIGTAIPVAGGNPVGL